MKRIFTIIILLSSLLFNAGCKKWLDVTPQGQATQEELFKTEKGFKDALTGAYIRMKDGNIYGGSLMWGTIEYMACNWDASSSNTVIPQLKAGNYNDANVRTGFDNTYQTLFKVIADVNSILEKIEDKKPVFTASNYEIVKGESLALRAFCHFDALRFYGPMPTNPGAALILPYVKEVNKDIHPLLPYQEFIQNILADLDQAEALLRDIDPIRKYTIAELNPGTAVGTIPAQSDNYLQYRQVRMNYYAILALKARVYLWLAAMDSANKINATKYAKMVIDAMSPNGATTFRLGVESDRASQDYTMSPEHIMALSVYNLETIATNTFGQNGSVMKYDFSPFYYLTVLFPANESVSDIRFKDMWIPKSPIGTATSNDIMYRKFIQKAGALPESQVLQVPLLRLSEMYLIMTECAETKAAAEAVYTIYCASKGIPFISFNSADWLTDRRNKMVREYVREFYGEGQSFFCFKRLGVTTLPASWTATYYTGTPAKYVVPKPLREINYNNN
ncbi:RagB/SusD family nutrient uptake outer membrane protein [Pedobacter sp. MC2016-14]|uniref:RagB/SusD family nutrient uptake outer membrane protein n=1 Tax=Pedobacter sp. MC2016-14 TaxID=2897327 RepID=UPI001E4114A1|nr:RagB/SusD family nutrient uptake outer membrane protein [Pedobacter sp. MC2016-14]MCD0488715.1 RagB/SusD family nutrient uptake outer membrane protein [Pedobacter sp. MC2016-14]